MALLGDDCTAELLAEAAPRAGGRHGTQQIFLPGEFGRDGHHRTSRWLFDCAFAPLPRHGANRAHGGAGFPVRESARSPRRAPAPHAAGKAGACGFAAISRLPACHVARKIHHELVATTSVAEQPVSANCGAQQSDLSWAQPHNAVALNENFLPSSRTPQSSWRKI